MREIPYNHETGNVPPSLADAPFLARLDSELLDHVLANSTILAKRLEECSTRLAETEAELHKIKSGPAPDTGRFKL